MNLRTFFKNKNLPVVAWDIVDKSGLSNHVPNEVVVEFIIADKQQQKAHSQNLSRIDFVNGDVNNYLRYIAEFMVNM